jgi:serine/threonine protein kinase
VDAPFCNPPWSCPRFACESRVARPLGVSSSSKLPDCGACTPSACFACRSVCDVLEAYLVETQGHNVDSGGIAARVGRTLREKWHLEQLIAVGGTAAVYAATHRNGLRGAVKVLHDEWSCNPDAASRFRREGYIANRVEHPDAVRVLDDDVDVDGSVFLVMELLVGATLDDRAAKTAHRLPADQVLFIVDRVLGVIAAAHERGIIHRDIKPDNIFLTTTGDVKVLDFGIAHLGQPGPHGPAITREGIPMGTPAFMSPEQARGRWDLVGVQSDLWSVGATMFKLLSGEFVHDESTAAETLAAAFTKPARSLVTVLPDAPSVLIALVDRALAHRFADRWPDARTMRTAVHDAYLVIYGVPLPQTAIDPESEPRSLAYSSTRPSPSKTLRAMSFWAIASAFALVLTSAAALFAVGAARAARPPLTVGPALFAQVVAVASRGSPVTSAAPARPSASSSVLSATARR